MKLGVLVALVAAAVLATAGASYGEPVLEPTKHPVPKVVPKKHPKPGPKSCIHARYGLAFYRGWYMHWQLKRDASIETGRKPRNCADARYLAGVWEKRARKSRILTQRYVKRMAQRMLKEQPHWIRAINEAQKAYPGTSGWLRSCSASEGAGRNLSQNTFVMNRQGSGAGGWLQFMEGTFKGFISRAVADVKGRGFIVPDSAWSWNSRLGQALAGGWAITHGMRHHWSGSGC